MLIARHSDNGLLQMKCSTSSLHKFRICRFGFELCGWDKLVDSVAVGLLFVAAITGTDIQGKSMARTEVQ